MQSRTCDDEHEQDARYCKMMRRKRPSAVTPDGPMEAGPSRLPAPPGAAGAPAQRGRRTETPSDFSVTHRLERVSIETTPAPLPPSPAGDDSGAWFEQVPTNPAAPNLAEHLPQRPSSGVLYTQAALPATVVRPAGDARLVGDGRPAWLVPVLIAATSLTIGMILGALLFGGGRHPGKSPSTPSTDTKP